MKQLWATRGPFKSSSHQLEQLPGLQDSLASPAFRGQTAGRPIPSRSELRAPPAVWPKGLGPLAQPAPSRAGCTQQGTHCSPGVGSSITTSLSKASLISTAFPRRWQGILPLRPLQLKSPKRTCGSSLHPVMLSVALKICFWCVFSTVLFFIFPK